MELHTLPQSYVIRLSDLSYEAAQNLLFQVYQHLSDLNVKAAPAASTSWSISSIFRRHTQSEPITPLDTSLEIMETIHEVRKQLLHDICKGKLGLGCYRFREQGVNIRALREHMPYLSCMPSGLSPFSWTYQFYRMIDTNIEIDLTLLPKLTRTNALKLTYAIYKHLSDLNAKNPDNIAPKVLDIVDLVRRRIYIDVCEGVFGSGQTKQYYIGSNADAQEAAESFFPASDIQILNTVPLTYIYQPSRRVYASS